MEKDKAPNIGKTQESSPDASRESLAREYREAASAVSRDIEVLCRIFSAREQDRLNQVVNPADIPKLAQTARLLIDVSPDTESDYELIGGNLATLATCIESLGTFQSKGVIDNLRNLEALFKTLSNLNKSSRSLAENFQKIGPEMQLMSQMVNRIADLSYDKAQMFFQRYKRLEDYLDAR